jgi:hypothetical protein
MVNLRFITPPYLHFKMAGIGEYMSTLPISSAPLLQYCYVLCFLDSNNFGTTHIMHDYVTLISFSFLFFNILNLFMHSEDAI